jgi:hypothetical protein
MIGACTAPRDEQRIQHNKKLKSMERREKEDAARLAEEYVNN